MLSSLLQMKNKSPFIYVSRFRMNQMAKIFLLTHQISYYCYYCFTTPNQRNVFSYVLHMFVHSLSLHPVVSYIHTYMVSHSKSLHYPPLHFMPLADAIGDSAGEYLHLQLTVHCTRLHYHRLSIYFLCCC